MNSMNRQIILYWLLCTFLCVPYLIKAQTARELFEDQKYLESALAYEYDYFLNRDDSLLLKKSYCYKALGNYSQSLENLNRINWLDVRYEKALMYYLDDQPENAYQELLSLKSEMKFGDLELILLEILVQVSRLKYVEAKELALLHADVLNLNEEEVNDIFSRKVMVKNPQKAYNISLFLPGIGQWYAGHFGKGLLSGTIQSGIAVFTGWSTYTGYYFSGTLSGAALFYTFYLGGARYARQLAIEKNEEISRQVREKILIEIP